MQRQIRNASISSALFLALNAASAQSYEREMEARVEKLIAQHGNGTDEALQQRLRAMGKRDQAVRTAEYFSDRAPETMVREQERVDDELTAELKEIVAQRGWPAIRLVGLGASEDAALVLTHSRDHAWQRQLLPELQRLAESGEILRSTIPGIVDKILVAEGKPQRFGTQFKWANGKGAMLPVEDPTHLGERRARYWLPPMAEYKKTIEEMYHVKIE